MKLILDQDILKINFFEDTKILGIIAPLKSHFFCWQINKSLGTEFKLNNEIEIQVKRKKRDYYFNIYEWKESDCFLKHYIYHNQFDGEYLLPELRNMDFIWLMKGEIEEEQCKTIIEAIKNISSVQLVVELSNEQIKNKDNIIFF